MMIQKFTESIISKELKFLLRREKERYLINWGHLGHFYLYIYNVMV